jgi:hypothetical protein
LKTVIIQLFLICCTFICKAQYAFELQVDYSSQIENTNQYAISGTLEKGKIENDKTYFLESGAELRVTNLISGETGTSVKEVNAPQKVSIALLCRNFKPALGVKLNGISTKPNYGGYMVKDVADKMPEGLLSCKVNGVGIKARQISKPVYSKNIDALDLFFEAENKAIIWLQVNSFSKIVAAPHHLRTDTSNIDKAQVCKIIYLPNGYRPTDLPNNYMGYEDVKGNAAMIITRINKYAKQITLEFSGILRANKRMKTEKPEASLFYISEGRVDNSSWTIF